ncbi:glucose-6-phosphatase 3 isoform 1-T3 [Discoglossus pictus]
MDNTHRTGVAIAAVLQERLPGSEEFWLWVTHLGDPSSIFLIYFPVSYCFHRRLGVTVLWIALITEWLNVLFKWFLFGDRPFWWIYQSGEFQNITLRQFPSTCETGPGSPSGHCMITGAALWPVMKSLTNLSQSPVQRLAPLLLYTLLMVGIAISRVFILAHFPHQALGGILTGVFLGYVLQRHIPHERSLYFFARASFLLLIGAVVLHWGMSTLGVDISWSIDLAIKWCARPEWIHPETRPFSSVTRCAGNALGLGLALNCPLYNQLIGDHSGWGEKGLSLFLSILFSKILYILPFPMSSHLLFYVLNFLRHLLCPLAVIILAPVTSRSLSMCQQNSPKND